MSNQAHHSFLCLLCSALALSLGGAAPTPLAKVATPPTPGIWTRISWRNAKVTGAVPGRGWWDANLALAAPPPGAALILVPAAGPSAEPAPHLPLAGPRCRF